MADTRTFTFLSPNDSTLFVNMARSQTMDDGITSLSIWSFSDNANTSVMGGFNGDRFSPGPVIEMIEGVDSILTFSSGPPHSVHLHGLDTDDLNDGVPSTSGFIAANPAPFLGPDAFGRVGGVNPYNHLGATFVYQFEAPPAGTYLYHCHVDTALHMERGMAGTIISRPANGSATQAYTGGPTYQKEYVWHLHAYDSRWHEVAISGLETDLDMDDPTAGRITSRYRPDFFMINARDNSGATAEIADSTVALSALGSERVMIRINNIGHLPATVKLGGLSFDVVASDGRPLRQVMTTTELLVGAAERYDLIFTMPEPTDGSSFSGGATVEYHDIRMKRILGTATTSITGGQNAIFKDSYET